MSGQRGSGSIVAWVLAAVALAGWALSAKPKSAPPPREVAPLVAARAPRAEPTAATPPIQPAALLAAAKAFASHGLTYKADRVASYALAAKFLAAVPSDSGEATEAAVLRREIEARQRLRDIVSAPPPNEREIIALVDRLERGPRPGTLAIAPTAVRPTTMAVPLGTIATQRSAPPISVQRSLTQPREPEAIPPLAPLTAAVPCAENGSCFGDISSVTGQPKTTQVNGYYRKNGTYVRGHYRGK